jgi:hypothetical protein
MDFFVCGDFGSISCGTWIAFWNGAIGAVFAAITGALVALGVVFLANGQNTRQAEKSRQMSAIADFVAAAESIVQAREPDARGYPTHDVLLMMRAAHVRLRMSGNDVQDLAEAIRDWPYRLYQLEFRVGPRAEPLNERQLSAWRLLRISVAAILVTLPDWMHASKSERKTLVRHMSKKLREVEDFMVAADREDAAAKTEAEAST